jgi:hypothetical protein
MWRLCRPFGAPRGNDSTGGPSSPTSPLVLPRGSTNDYVQSAAPACSPQRPGTPAGAGRAYLTWWRRGPGLSYLLGRAGLTLASPYATFRWPCEPASQWLWKLRSLRSDRCFLIGLRVCLSFSTYLKKYLGTALYYSTVVRARTCELGEELGDLRAAITFASRGRPGSSRIPHHHVRRVYIGCRPRAELRSAPRPTLAWDRLPPPSRAEDSPPPHPGAGRSQGRRSPRGPRRAPPAAECLAGLGVHSLANSAVAERWHDAVWRRG